MTTPFMARALALGNAARGTTHPNPPVGAVLTCDGRVVGEGHTQPAGGAHAEIIALEQAGSSASGADLFVTLEPCSHWGKTPPCADALIAAGIRSAHIALLDPNPRVDGRGVGRLRDHGIEVVIGDGEDEARILAEIHLHRSTMQRPFLMLAAGLPPGLQRRLAGEADAVLNYRDSVTGPAVGNGMSLLFLAGESDAGRAIRDLKPDRVYCGSALAPPPGYRPSFRHDLPRGVHVFARDLLTDGVEYHGPLYNRL